MKFLQRLHHASLFIPQRVKAIKEGQNNHALADSITLMAIILLVGYSWNFAMIFEGFTRVSPTAGLSELLYLIHQLVIMDLVPLLILTIIFKYFSGVKGTGRHLALAIALWTQPLLIRLVMQGIPMVYPRLNYYPVPLFEVPQLVSYMWALLSLGFALSCCKSGKKRPKKRSGWFFHPYASYGWALVLLVGAVSLYWYPLAKAIPLFIKAPTFVIPSSDNKTCDLSAQKGKVVLLEFWSRRCPHCRKQIKEMKAIADEIDPKEVTIFAVHTGGGEAAKKVVEQMMHHKNIQNCFDDGSVSHVYRGLPPYHRLRGVPHTMIIDRNGIIRKVIRGRKDSAIIMDHLKRVIAR